MKMFLLLLSIRIVQVGGYSQSPFVQPRTEDLKLSIEQVGQSKGNLCKLRFTFTNVSNLPFKLDTSVYNYNHLKVAFTAKHGVRVGPAPDLVISDPPLFPRSSEVWLISSGFFGFEGEFKLAQDAKGLEAYATYTYGRLDPDDRSLWSGVVTSSKIVLK